jgi:leader peptidase (prepilin peptidase)/N-methyltransferase
LVEAAAGILGLVIGSFLNVVIYRLPLMLERDWRRQCQEMLHPEAPAAPAPAPFNLLRPRSACPACKAPIRPQHNVPVLGYLWLRGRCAACGTHIPLRYPLVEALTGMLTALLVWRFGVTIECAGLLLLGWSLVTLTVIDLDHQLLPDIITLPLLWLGVLFSLLGGDASQYQVIPELRASVTGALAGYLSLWSVYQLFRLLTGKEGMGYGDFKLFAVLGAWLGWQMLPLIILLAALVGALTGIGLILFRGHDRQSPIPFGPYLAAAGFVALMWGNSLVTAYRQMSGL